jgi:hypothetical protein
VKKIIYTFLVIAGLTFVANAQQVSLYDREGEARAYIDYDEEATIFMWDGTPVAFVEKDGSDLCVFGFNGSFLGWYEDGIICEMKGYAVGARKGAVNMITKIERIKGIQRTSPMRPITPIQPILKSSWSNTSLTEFLFYGKK